MNVLAIMYLEHPVGNRRLVDPVTITSNRFVRGARPGVTERERLVDFGAKASHFFISPQYCSKDW